jgi:biotin carboxyl carrier protein/biotin carboxylase
VIIYNQSKHASQSVVADIRAVWGANIRIIQTIEDGLQRLPNVDGALYVGQKRWGDMEHFAERLDALCAKDHSLHAHRSSGQVCFMPGWSAFAESPEAAVAVMNLGLVWPGTEPVASETLEKIGFKRICEKVGAPTPPFKVLSEEGLKVNLQDEAAREACIQDFMKSVASMNTSEKGLIKSIHGGGGKGTAHLDKPQDPAEVRASVEKVLNEMNRPDGIYFEQKVNQKGDGRFYQLELEVDGDVVADGGRFVWFNSRLQKVVEIGLSDDHLDLFMPKDLYLKSREWSKAIAQDANNNTRATMEALVFKNEKGEVELQFIECNRRPQVENEALALLQVDSSGYRRYTFAELMMRAKGYPAPTFGAMPNTEVVLHARWLHGNPDHNGDITYQAGNVLGMSGPRLDYVPAELMAPGEISFTSDPQLGKAVITANSWKQMCERAANYFTLRRPTVLGSSSTYAQTMYNLFTNPKFVAGEIASNETFKYLDIPEYSTRTVLNVLEDQVAPVLVKGYRPGEGIDPDRYPTPRIIASVQEITESLSKQVPRATKYTEFARGTATYDEYIKSLRGQLADQGGAWVTVAPRDTAQQGNDSESCSVSSVSRMNAEVWAQQAGCVGYETGGAQYQAGLIRGFDPAAIMCLGLPYNMPAHSLQRSQYVNGLTELPSTTRQALFDATADVVASHYRPEKGVGGLWVPWAPYNFHAGNFYDPATKYSAQDETTAELLKAKCLPMPSWVFSPKFPLSALKDWTGRNIDMFAAAGQQLHALRIKNPGQGKDWTAETIWEHCKVVNSVFKEKGLDMPIMYIHNHDFNGLGGHVGAALLRMAQKEGYSNLVIDAAYRKNGTHNDNTIVTDALNFTREQNEALIEYGHVQQQIEQVLCRFDSRTSQMTPWDSDWAGGTEGSDIRICKEFDINPRLINHAKEVATEVFPLERAVTPFSEYKLRLGIGIMIEEGIQPKSADAVRAWVKNGGKLKVGGDVLVGLKRWETLVPKTEYVDMLLKNMPDELNAALGQGAKLVKPEDLPKEFTSAQIHTALGYQQKGLDFAKAVKTGADLSPLLIAPAVLHSKPRSLPAGTKFEIFDQPGDLLSREQVEFTGFGKAPNGDIEMGFKIKGAVVVTTLPDPDANISATVASGPRKATPGNKHELACIVPGEVLTYNVAVGDVLEAGKPLVVLESMKMEMKISVPDEIAGLKVKALPCKIRTKEFQGDILAPGDLLLELEDA